MTRDVRDVTHRNRGLRFEKSQLVEFCRRKKKVDFRLLIEALRQVSHVVWGRWKSQVYHSPYVEKPLNSEVIKSFVPELRSRKCFSCFGIPMCVMNIQCTFHISVFISDYATFPVINIRYSLSSYSRDRFWGGPYLHSSCKFEGHTKRKLT